MLTQNIFLSPKYKIVIINLHWMVVDDKHIFNSIIYFDSKNYMNVLDD